MNRMTKSNFESVCEFNKSFGLPHFDTPQTNILTDDEKISNLRINLCKEEVGEYNDALKTKNFTEVIDALTDELYVIYGAGSTFGVNLDKLFCSKIIDFYSNKFKKQKDDNEFLEDIMDYSNYDMLKYILIRKVDLFTYKRCNNLNTDDIFSETFLKSIDYDNLRIILYELNLNLNISILKLEKEKNLQNFNETIDILIDLLHYTYKIGIFLGINLDKSFKIVHSSNMSKLCVSEEEAKNTVEWYKLNETRYKTPCYRKSYDNKYWVVFNKDTGKILKSINYTPADFSKLF